MAGKDKEQLVADEMFPDLTTHYMDIDEMPSNYMDYSGYLQQSNSNDKCVHSDFYNKFDDLFDEDDLE